MGWDGARLPRCATTSTALRMAHTYARTTRRRRLLPHASEATTRAKCTRLGAQGVRTHNRKTKNAQCTALPYRTVALVLVMAMVSLLLLSQTSGEEGLPCGRLLVFHGSRMYYLHCRARESSHHRAGGGSPLLVFAVAVAAVAVAFAALPEFDRIAILQTARTQGAHAGAN